LTPEDRKELEDMIHAALARNRRLQRYGFEDALGELARLLGWIIVGCIGLVALIWILGELI